MAARASDPQVAELDGWIPINLDNDFGGATLCRLNFAAHAANPAKVPMFKDLVRVSDCGGAGNSKHVPWSMLERIAKATKQPNGFVFHESRVGSTLVADMLASDPQNMVFSESRPPPLAVAHCHKCTESKKVDLLRTIILAMGNSVRSVTILPSAPSRRQNGLEGTEEVCCAAFPSLLTCAHSCGRLTSPGTSAYSSSFNRQTRRTFGYF